MGTDADRAAIDRVDLAQGGPSGHLTGTRAKGKSSPKHAKKTKTGR
ncbi:hypothetical protein BN12_60040 [Nostocoides japonicum T1-X7]|uniref:Uncharacterized protein n=1 Tax=Nostocoides japonicum T1-X7 TaxID=1194083 RepID=A0A077M6N2_9MICO|nr:hypothetical protein BN12_60040 [Tetrasphaera japonica T1-X7]